MAIISTIMAISSVISFLILWGVIHIGSRVIPPKDGMPIWKSFVIAAIAVVINMLLVGLIVGAITPAG